eukprot:6191444-Pleurochrysis_carterae.AAC.1
MHVTDFDDEYLPLARIDDDMLLFLHTTAANASEVLPRPRNYKDINGRHDEQDWRAVEKYTRITRLTLTVGPICMLPYPLLTDTIAGTI